MADLPDVNITYRNGNGRRAPGEDHISGFVFGAVAVVSTFALGTTYPINSVAAAEALGLNAAYDLTNKVLVYNHIKRFYARRPGATLYIMGVAQGTTLAQMCDKTLSYAKKLINDAGGKVRQLAVVLNPDMSDYDSSLSGGLDADVIAAIPKAKALREEAVIGKRPLVVLIEGREFNGSASAAADLRTKNAPGVGVVIAADPYLTGLHADFANTAAMGDVLGIMAAAKVNQSLGNNLFQLTNEAENMFVSAGLTNGVTVENQGADDLGTLLGKGYIVPRQFSDVAGYRIAGSPACTAATEDLAWLPSARSIDKALRIAYKTLVPDVEGEILLNEDGTPQPVDIGDFQSKVKTAVEQGMVGEVSSIPMPFIDPAQNVFSTGELNMEVGIIEKGTLRQINVSLGFGVIPV